MNRLLKENQHKRIIALSAMSLIFAYFVLWKLGEQIFAGGQFAGWDSARQAIYLFCACTLMVCAVVLIAVRSFQDEARMKYLDDHDVLTGLASKSALIEKVGQLQISKNACSGVLFLIDVARLKSFNSSLGREGGDEILKEIAGRLQFAFEQPAILARFGAGTFAVAIPGVVSRAAIMQISEEGPKSGGPKDINPLLQSAINRIEELLPWNMAPRAESWRLAA